ncbi:MAG: SH3 domain-containing protein [Bacteroidales bacterium]|nr:SH3 domain-containing protein [Bacteroidales bacterium]
MAKKNVLSALAAFIGFIVVIALVGSLVLRLTRRQEIGCFILNPEDGALTDIYAKPDGEVVFQVDAADFYQLTAVPGPDGWWKIKNSRLTTFGEDIEIPSREAWIRQSELALGTDNADGQYRFLRTEPRPDAPKAGTITEFNAVVQPLELSSNGKWVKVCYEPADLTGWIEVSWMRDEAFEPGDGYDFPTLMVYVAPEGDIVMREAPGKGEITFLLEQGKKYEMWVAKAKDGWWQMVSGYLTCDGEDILVPDESWIPASAACMRVCQDSVPVYSRADEESRVAGTLENGMVVHPLDVAGVWPRWVRVVADEKPSLTGWVMDSYENFSTEE